MLVIGVILLAVSTASGSGSVNDEFVIGLKGNPTTGYTWVPKYSLGSFEVVERWYIQDPECGGRLGCGGTEYFKFKALRSGFYSITFQYMRPWEGKSIDTKSFNIRIFSIE